MFRPLNVTVFGGATENAGVEKSGADRRGGKCRSGKCGRIGSRGWKIQE